MAECSGEFYVCRESVEWSRWRLFCFCFCNCSFVKKIGDLHVQFHFLVNRGNQRRIFYSGWNFFLFLQNFLRVCLDAGDSPDCFPFLSSV